MLEIGMPLNGYCNGYFGRDGYDNRRVEAFGYDWIVCRCDDGGVAVVTFHSQVERDKMVAEWVKIYD